MTTMIELGTQYVSGNVFAPRRELAKRLLTWAELPESAKRRERIISYWYTEEQFQEQMYVCYIANGRRDYSSTRVYAATRYRTVADMSRAYGGGHFSVNVTA